MLLGSQRAIFAGDLAGENADSLWRETQAPDTLAARRRSGASSIIPAMNGAKSYVVMAPGNIPPITLARPGRPARSRPARRPALRHAARPRGLRAKRQHSEQHQQQRRPTATKAPLSAVPQITLAFCQGLVSLSDANNIMHPASPITSIVPDNARPGGSCSYTSSSHQAGIPLSLYFQPFPAGTSLNAIAQQAVAQAEAKNGIPPGLSFNITPVSGIGDQALYGSASGTFSGISVFYAALDTTIGSVWISCFNFGEGSPTIPQQPALTQVCTQVVSRI